jgi:hypothetical protein
MTVLSSCFVSQPGKVIGEGISGTIYLLSGNQMPGPGRPQSKGRGVSRVVYIYEATTPAQTTGASPLFNHIKTKLIAQTKSDSTGHYAVKLPPGKYSVFIAEGAQYFAAESDGTGALNPVNVLPKTLTTKDFTINTGAVY